MANSISTNSQLMEYIALTSSFIHCCIMLFLYSEDILELKLVLYAFVFANLAISHYYRGTRIHLWPLIFGFSCYSVALLFETLEEITFYYYYLMCLVSIMLVYFFGTSEFYSKFELSGQYAVGCIQTETKIGANRILIYYPTEKYTKEIYSDLKWAIDGEHMLNGFIKFAANIIPQGPFYYMLSLK